MPPNSACLSCFFSMLGILAASAPHASEPTPLNLREVVVLAAGSNPLLLSDSAQLELASLRAERLSRDAILPRFDVSVAFGPAPGFRFAVDPITGDSIRRFDWWPLGPYFGTEVKLAQPLNIDQLRAGVAAARAGVGVERAELAAAQSRQVLTLAGVWFDLQVAGHLHDGLEKAARRLDAYERDLEDRLDEDDPSVSQEDLMRLRVRRAPLDRGLVQARTGLRRARNGLITLLSVAGLDTSRSLPPPLALLPELPELDVLARRMEPTDWVRLQAGLRARKAQVDLARSRLGPEIFLFGNFNYTKSWISNRSGTVSGDVLLQDPINNIGGSVGLGFRWRLNYWTRLDDYREARVRLFELQHTWVHARTGINARLKDAWLRYREARDLEASIARALRAADAWVKAVAIQADLDPSRQGDLIEPYSAFLNLSADHAAAVRTANHSTLEVLAEVGFLHRPDIWVEWGWDPATTGASAAPGPIHEEPTDAVPPTPESPDEADTAIDDL